MTKASELSRRLRRLEPRELAQVSGGRETASTSTSGTPEAGDDTVGDQSFSTGLLLLDGSVR